MSRVTVTKRNAVYTLRIMGEDGNVQVKLRVTGPLPAQLDELSAQANAGDLQAAERYIDGFLKHWQSQQQSDWIDLET
ncbi:MAG: hypothetical protein ACE5Q3_19100, partial [Alphaproteobacteria bacterium]